MEDISNYIAVLDFCKRRVLKIKLSKEKKEYAKKGDDFEEIIDRLSENYRFSFSNCQWMVMQKK